MTARTISFSIFLLTTISVQAQSTSSNALSFPSSNNSFLGKTASAISVGVDHYTGTAQVNVPICELASRELTIPINLNYVDGRGVRVSEYASQVGLGWQLNAGGSVSRVVRGFPDELANGYLGTGQWGQKVYQGFTGSGGYQNFFSTLYNISPSYDYMLSGLNETNDEPIADGEPDLFSVKTPFFSFQFVFDKDGNAVFSNYNGYRIIPVNFINTSGYPYSSFEVIDDKGNQFYFGNTTNSTEQAQDSAYGQLSAPFITSWYLTKIVTYNSKDAINFTYQAATSNDVTNQYSWMETQDNNFVPAHTKIYLCTGNNTVFNPKYVSTISSSLGELDFYYSFTRTDDPNVPYLASIVEKSYNPQTTLQSYNFNYSYFNNGFTNTNYLRLQLTGVTVTGNTSATSTPATLASFGYNTSAQLPDRTTPVFDYLGYNTTMPGSIPADIFNINRSPNVTMAQAGILNSVTTLLGGTWNISYELNTYGTTTVGGLRVNYVSETLQTGESINKTYQYADASGNPSGQIYNAGYNSLQVTTGYTNNNPFVVYFSSSPYTVNDVNGVFEGYSYVKEINQKGGYTLFNFTNFTDFNDIYSPSGNALSFLHTPTTSYAYKRGLLKDKQIRDANNNLVSETIYNYTSQSTLANSAYGMHVVILPTVLSTVWNTYGFYSTTVENYLLTGTTRTDYQQYNTANSNITNYVQTITSYAYDVNVSNKSALIKSVSTTDSKLQNSSKTFYYPSDSGIPLVSTGTTESQAIAGMSTANRINLPIHEVESRNGTITEIHNTFLTGFGSGNYSNSPNAYLASITSYNTISGVQAQFKQQQFVYDQSTYNVITSSSFTGFAATSPGSKPLSFAYGYNQSYPIAKIENASSSVAIQPQTATGTLNIPGGNYGTFTTSFRTYFLGTITIAMPAGSYLAGSVTCFFNFTLSGAGSGSGSLCDNSASGYTCSYPNSVSFSNMPAGNYTLSVSPSTNTASVNNLVPVNFTYNYFQPITTAEFFFEGFEQNSSATQGAAHTGNMYYNANYTVPYTPPNGRSYLIQYWNLSNGSWIFNEKTYTTNMVVTGPVDDIRIFPSDALMTSYTYNPLVGQTSETDPSGKSVINQYDGLNRLQTVLDQDYNVLKQFDYEYQLLVTPVTNVAESGSFQRSCPANQIGSYVTYTVLAGKYSSYISQADANQQAINDVNANGQAYANNPANGGTCTPSYTINYSDSRTFQYTVRFTNNSTGLVYNFTSNANSSGTLGQVPAGTYTVYICPINNYTNNNNYNVNGSVQTGVVCATFNNISVNSNISISFY